MVDEVAAGLEEEEEVGWRRQLLGIESQVKECLRAAGGREPEGDVEEKGSGLLMTARKSLEGFLSLLQLQTAV